MDLTDTWMDRHQSQKSILLKNQVKSFLILTIKLGSYRSKYVCRFVFSNLPKPLALLFELRGMFEHLENNQTPTSILESFLSTASVEELIASNLKKRLDDDVVSF